MLYSHTHTHVCLCVILVGISFLNKKFGVMCFIIVALHWFNLMVKKINNSNQLIVYCMNNELKIDIM